MISSLVAYRAKSTCPVLESQYRGEPDRRVAVCLWEPLWWVYCMKTVNTRGTQSLLITTWATAGTYKKRKRENKTHKTGMERDLQKEARESNAKRFDQLVWKPTRIGKSTKGTQSCEPHMGRNPLGHSLGWWLMVSPGTPCAIGRAEPACHSWAPPGEAARVHRTGDIGSPLGCRDGRSSLRASEKRKEPGHRHTAGGAVRRQFIVY